MRLSLLLAQRAFCLVQQGYASGQVRCTLQLFVALLFSKFYNVLVPPPDELEQPGAFLFPLPNEPEPRADACHFVALLNILFIVCHFMSSSAFATSSRPGFFAACFTPITVISCVPGMCLARVLLSTVVIHCKMLMHFT
jgi:hypothetical protein